MRMQQQAEDWLAKAVAQTLCTSIATCSTLDITHVYLPQITTSCIYRAGLYGVRTVLSNVFYGAVTVVSIFYLQTCWSYKGPFTIVNIYLFPQNVWSRLAHLFKLVSVVCEI